MASIIGGKTPTITMLCARHRWLAPAVLAVLAVHLYGQPVAHRKPARRHSQGVP
jgi:hypothetical protein